MLMATRPISAGRNVETARVKFKTMNLSLEVRSAGLYHAFKGPRSASGIRNPDVAWTFGARVLRTCCAHAW
jgi:hypothetical protein